MSRMTWNAPEGRFFDTGLDRGVLFPKGAPPLGELLATNYVTNPSFEINTTGWITTGAGSVISRDTTEFASGVASMKIVTNGAAAGQGAYYVPVTIPALVLGTTFGIQVKVKAPLNAQLEVSAVNSLDGAGSTRAVQIIGTGNWQTVVVTGAQLVTNKSPYLMVRTKIGVAQAITFRLDDAMIFTGSTIPSYFDGSSESGLYTFAWAGTEHASFSTKRELLTKAVPWLGLTGVEESGGDGAAAYYIDGRPFLFLPKPKEYKATIKALTYPDEFAEIMGVSEVADGMYLDSQAGDSFDFSYRTLVGNAISGVDHGYKIHLVYNATVTPQTLTYETLSNSINPTEFSWEIQAVPVLVEGFRPTAHIIIDTRHMNAEKIAKVEAMIYGSDDSLPNMPNPQTVFDLLSFGDTIIVTDNGDGTYSVEGSYENVYMTGPGIFRVDNVDAVDLGDGTFTISTTIA